MKKLIASALLLSALGMFLVSSPPAYASRDTKPPKPTKSPTPIPSPALRIPYACGEDMCGGYRCVIGNLIRPACYNNQEIVTTSCTGGTFEYIPTFNACYATQYYLDWGI